MTINPTGPADWTPDHYRGDGMQPFDVIDAFGLDFYEGNALKYLLRWRKKNGVEDLCKARTYLQVLIDQHGGDEGREATKAEAASDEDLNEARMWARHGYEIGQRHCSWSDHGVAPAWLTNGWPMSFDSCEHLKRAGEYDMALSRVRALHRAVEHRSGPICAECSALDDMGSTDNAPVAHPCATVQALDVPEAAGSAR